VSATPHLGIEEVLITIRPLDIFPLFDAPTQYTTYVRAIDAISGNFPNIGEIYGVNGLRVKKGEVFEIWERWNGDYWLGSINGWCGLVPIDSRTAPLVGSQVRAIWARTATNSDELSFEAGQIIGVVTQLSNWWIMGEYETPGVDGGSSQRHQGIVPFNFVESIPPEGLDDNICRISVHTSSGDPSTRWIRTPGLQVRAQWSYKAPKESDMDLKAGEIINVTRKWSDTWYYGYANERVGRFPAKYVTEDLNRVVYVRKRPPHSRFYVRARYDYTPAAEKRMTLIKNEIIEILWILSSNWYEGRSLDGKRKGSVPATFVREIRNGHGDW
ncbi:hypothetical protein FRC17_000099, partial [Serendipita sp. 399]